MALMTNHVLWLLQAHWRAAPPYLLDSGCSCSLALRGGCGSVRPSRKLPEPISAEAAPPALVLEADPPLEETASPLAVAELMVRAGHRLKSRLAVCRLRG